MHKPRQLVPLCGLALLAACAEEPPPRSVQEFMENPIALEAAMVRCSQNRSETRYDAECVNARQAITIIEAKEDRARRDALEKQSARKREALWRTQKAAAEARRRAAEAARRREEAAYLAQFGVLPPPPEGDEQGELGAANSPGALIPSAPEAATDEPESNVVFDELPPRNPAESAVDGGNAPVVEQEPASNLSDVREELRRRNEDSSN